LLEDCPLGALPVVVCDALAQLTLAERLSLGNRLPAAVGLRAEAILASLDVLELDVLLDAADVDDLGEMVRPCLTWVLS
jgi:hypothetical protein